MKEKFADNHGHNILSLFDGWVNFALTNYKLRLTILGNQQYQENLELFSNILLMLSLKTVSCLQLAPDTFKHYLYDNFSNSTAFDKVLT